MRVSGHHVSSPRSVSRALDTPALTGGANVDVCLVGAGLAGMIAAYLLARDKRSVMVLEGGPLGGVHGGMDAAHVASVVEAPYSVLEAQRGADGARVAAQSYGAAVDVIESIVRREHIACEFERLDGYWRAGDRDDVGALEQEHRAAQRAGVEGVELVRERAAPGSGWGPCVRYPGQAHFHPTRFLAGLARAIVREGGRVHCGVQPRALEAAQPACLVTSAGHRIGARTVVSTQPLRPGSRLSARAAPRIAHAVGLRVARGTITRALYWESAQPARWARLRSHGTGAGEVLMVGGEDPPGEEDHTAYRYLELERWARERFPQAGEVVQRFTGQVVEALDVFAFTSRGDGDSETVYVPAGDWGTAMTRATIAALVLKDFVDGAELPSAELYVPEACNAAHRASQLARELA